MSVHEEQIKGPADGLELGKESEKKKNQECCQASLA